MFLFKYPQQKFKRGFIMDEIRQNHPNLDPEDIEAMFEAEIEKQGLVDNIENLSCEIYPDHMVLQDDEAAGEFFDQALQEVQQADE